MNNLPEPDPAANSSGKPRLQTVKPSMGKPASLVSLSGVPAAVPKTETILIEQPADDAVDQESATIRDRLRRNRRPISSVLGSLVLHCGILLTLLWIAYHWPLADRLVPGVTAEFTSEPALETPDADLTETVDLEMPLPQPSPSESEADDISTEDMTLADSDIPSVTPVEAVQPTPSVSAVELPSNIANAAVTGGGLKGRDAESRASLAARHGGSQDSEAAVERALEWIVRHQHDDGGWRLQFHDGPCDGRCANEGVLESPNAATGLALLSLLGAGYTSDRGPYQKQVQSGLEFLIGRMRTTRHGGSFVQGEKGMYAQAIATMALSEAFAMTQDSSLAGPVEAAKMYIEKAQHRRGGWRYYAGQPGDMLVTGWTLMALKSVQQAGFRVSPEVLKQAEAFVDSLAVSQPGLYCYGSERFEGEPVATSVGMLMKMYQGRDRKHPEIREGALYLSDEGPSADDVYFNYYATLVLHHRRGSYWPRWNQQLRDHLVATQAADGHEAGSWHFNNVGGHGIQGGRLYSTAMAAMTLEVYYRFLPLYGYDPIADEQPIPPIQARSASE